LAIRLYLSALTLVFLIAAALSRGVSVLEGIVVTCALVYLTVDAREHLQLVKAKLETLQQLEEKLSALLHH
jgi:parvulin-like peptidyl-prolyl isomerase